MVSQTLFPNWNNFHRKASATLMVATKKFLEKKTKRAYKNWTHRHRHKNTHIEATKLKGHTFSMPYLFNSFNLQSNAYWKLNKIQRNIPRLHLHFTGMSARLHNWFHVENLEAMKTYKRVIVWEGLIQLLNFYKGFQREDSFWCRNWRVSAKMATMSTLVGPNEGNCFVIRCFQQKCRKCWFCPKSVIRLVRAI